MHSYEQLRQMYSTFYYNGYDLEQSHDGIQITYHFAIEGLASFSPTWTFPDIDMKSKFNNDKILRNMVFSLGLVELISYWKIACPPKVIIQNASMSTVQIRWWKRLYWNGLGEFFYTNGIMAANEQNFMEIIPENGITPEDSFSDCAADTDLYAEQLCTLQSVGKGAGCLVPIGGGKDSIVTLTVLQKYKPQLMAYIINPRGATLNTVKTAGMDADGRQINAIKLYAVKRTLDKKMLGLNKEGFLNGHTPFSAIVAFSATIAAYLNGLTYIVLSNESSANESTVPGSTVNHQYSKSFAFEKDFHEYERRYLKSGTYYFSLLRPLSEFQIAGIFAGCEAFHSIFRSCNVGSKEDKWCGHCPKCLFVWLILSPFLAQDKLVQIFGTNMADDETMKNDFEKLTGIADEKPFECVGSIDEVNAAVILTIRGLQAEGAALPYLFRYYLTTGLYEAGLSVCERYFGYYDRQHLLPPDFEEALRNTLQKNFSGKGIGT